MEAQAVEWWEFDWEYGETPVGGIANVYRDTELIKARKGAPKNSPL